MEGGPGVGEDACFRLYRGRGAMTMGALRFVCVRVCVCVWSMVRIPFCV